MELSAVYSDNIAPFPGASAAMLTSPASGQWSAGHTQRFLSAYGPIAQHFRLRWYLLSVADYHHETRNRLHEQFSSRLQPPPPSRPSRVGCPSPAIRSVRALRRGPAACRLPTGLRQPLARWRRRGCSPWRGEPKAFQGGACARGGARGRWKRSFEFPILGRVIGCTLTHS